MPLPPAPNKRAARLSPDQSEAANACCQNPRHGPHCKNQCGQNQRRQRSHHGGGPRLAPNRVPRALAVPAAATAPAARPQEGRNRNGSRSGSPSRTQRRSPAQRTQNRKKEAVSAK